MMNPEINLTTTQAEAFARGLFTLAKCDGLHEREAALVASFWSDAGGAARSLTDLERSPITPDDLAAQLGNSEARALFLKTSILLAWADGKVSDEERALLGAFAKSLGTSDADLAHAEHEVKEYLLSQLTHVKNTDATVAVAKKLGL